MSRLRRLVLSDRYFFVTCNLLRTKGRLEQDDFEILARVIQARRQEHGFLLSAGVFLPDPLACNRQPAISEEHLAGFGIDQSRIDATDQHSTERVGPIVAGEIFRPSSEDGEGRTSP